MERGTEWRVGAQGGVPTRLSWSAAARLTPAYGRHVAGARWSEAGATRRRERGGEVGHAAWLGRKGGGSSQQRLSLFFEFLFLQKGLNETFEAFTKLFRVWSKKNNCSP